MVALFYAFTFLKIDFYKQALRLDRNIFELLLNSATNSNTEISSSATQ